jgi:hypothetical protein
MHCCVRGWRSNCPDSGLSRVRRLGTVNAAVNVSADRDSAWEYEPGNLLPGSEQHCDVADAGDEGTARALCEGRKNGIPFLPVLARHTHLDQFVIGQCAGGFGYHGIGQTSIADEDDGLEGVRQTLQVPALLFG